jgi:dimethylamine monooxygenase subunit B
MKMALTKIDVLGPSIRRFTLTPVSGVLPVAGAGAHVVLEIPGPGRVWKNAYSITSAPSASAYEIIVRRVEHSRGGSAWLHDHAKLGDVLKVQAPQNLFPPSRTARKHLLLSAGIGITPFLSYLHVPGLNFEWHHCSKAEDAEAFAALLPDAPNVMLHNSRKTLNLAALLAAQRLDMHLSLCGPENFMDFALAAAEHAGWPAQKIHKESFGGATGGAPFIVHLRRSGRSINVGPDESLLDAMETAGLNPPCLCRGGACGQCILPVLEGIPEHHDHYLSASEHATNDMIMTCVSRAQTPELVLDF